MAKFGLMNVVDDLAKGNALQWNDVMELENSTALVAMHMAGTRAWIEFRMRQATKI